MDGSPQPQNGNNTVASKDLKTVLEQFVDYLMPELTPYEASLYVFLLRNTLLRDGGQSIRIGKRTIASNMTKGTRGNKANFAHITEVLKGLEEKQCVRIGDTDRHGTSYELVLPEAIPSVAQRLAASCGKEDEDYFTNPDRRKELFERDGWTCYYCGEAVTIENATLDHMVPQQAGGKHTKENLKTACWTCNSIKSGKTYEEAAPLLLRSMQQRRLRGLERSKP